jgi:CRP-like cAMP-binding protein
MTTGALGKQYTDGEVIVRQGDVGEQMFVVQEGEVQVIREADDRELELAVLTTGDVFGEMALFDREVRSATVRAKGDARVLTVDRRLFMRNVHEDPSLAFRILQRLSQRIRDLDAKLAELKAGRHDP